jgi:hypothetical protein
MRLRGYLLFLAGLVALFGLLLTTRRQTKVTMFKSITDYLVQRGFRFDTAVFIAAQAVHETGNFTSHIYKENNNLFGMKLAAIRPTTATGENYDHATYKSIEDSIQDYIYWSNFVGMPKSFNSVKIFVDYLKRKSYFEDTIENYLAGVLSALKKYGYEYN